MALSKIDVANMLTGLVPNDNTIRRPNAKPLWFNGNMQVSQRGDATGVTNNSAYHACDRYKFNEDGTMTAVLSITQETLTSGNAFTTGGHTKALKYDVTTADTAVANDIYARIEQRFEQQDLQVLKKGTANAEKVTLAFWVKATVTGTNVVEFQDQVNTRHCCATYTISSSDTWEHKVITFAADTSTGDPFGTGNGLAANINFVLQAGSNYTSGTLATAWADSVNANRAAGHNSNHFSSTSNNFHLTGVQLEVGEFTSSTLPPFQHESFEQNLARCQRYYYSLDIGGSNTASMGIGAMYTSNNIYCGIDFPVTMRATPTADFSTGTDYFAFNRNSGTDTFDTLALSESSTTSAMLYGSGNISGTAGHGGRVRFNNSSAGIAFTSEL